MYSSTLGGQFDVKSADELVASSRLNVIEREHKSFGSLIDHRQLFTLDDTPRPARKIATSTDSTAALSNLWKSAAFDQGLSTANQITEDIMNSSSNVINHSYANEELIWRTKSSVDKYFQKRAYEDPTLQTFRDNLTADQKKRSKDLTLKALHNLADKYRAEMAKVKDEMDIDGVFHPAANAHRVHCMYLMKIYKGISAQTIEDPVLRRLRAETISKKEAEDAEEERKQLLLRIATIGREDAECEAIARRSSMISLPASVSTSTKDPAFSPGPSSGRKEGGDKEKGETRANSRRQSRSLSREQSPARKDRRVSIVNAAPSPFLGNRRVSEVMSTGGVGIASERNSISKVLKERGEDESNDEVSSSSPSLSQLSKWNHDTLEPSMSSNTAANGGSIPHMDKLMFNKMRQKRLGAVDARSLLPEEANRLENASITDPKKSKHRSSLVNNENTIWMLEKLQHSNAGPGVKPPIDREGRDREKEREGGHQTDIVPFEEFHKMFEEYSAATAKEKARVKRETDGPSPSPSSRRLSRSSSSGTSRRMSLMEPGSDEDKLDSDAAMSAVQYLAKEDPLFESFLKMSLRDRSAGRRLTRVSVSNLMDPKMKRVSVPLGLSAVQLDPLTSNHHTPRIAYDNKSGSIQPNGSTSSSLCTNNFFTVDSPKGIGGGTGSGGKVANYMAATRQGSDADRYQRGPKLLGFANCFQSQEIVELSSVLKQSSDSLHEGSLNGFKERRILHPGPEPQGSVVDVTDPANIALKSLNQTQGNTRTMVLQRRRHEREREREEDGDSPGGDRTSRLPKTAAETETQASAMQRKLVQMWDCLQVPASERLDFMRKFSLYPYSMRLGIATDLWAEVAVLVMARQEIMKMTALIKSGFRRMPLLASELIDSIYLAVPLDLSSRSSVFLPLTVPVSAKTERGRADTDSESSKKNKAKIHPVPLSAAALSNMSDHINSKFMSFTDSYSTSGDCSTSEDRRGSTPSYRKSSLQTLMNALQPGRCRSMKTGTEGIAKLSFDDEEEEGEKEIVPLQIKSEEDAISCLLHLRKISDQLLLLALKKTLDEVSDVVTYGKVTVQEWMNASPDCTATPYTRRL